MIKVNDQVVYRQHQPFNNTNLIKLGHVVSIKDSKATVIFAADNSRQEISVDKLKPVSEEFSGRARVAINPLDRNII